MSKATRRQDGPPPTKRTSDRSSSSNTTNDIQNLLQVVRSHQRLHEDGTYDATSIQRCRAMLQKLKKVLPKLLRPISTLPCEVAVVMLNDMCELLQLLIHARVCPHANAVFVDDPRIESNDAVRGRGAHRNDAMVSSGAATQSFQTIATIVLYLVSFYCNERLDEAQAKVLDVVVQLVVLLQSRDPYASLHFFRDSVELLEDCLLLEECLRRTEPEADAETATIACFLNTAIHAFHCSDGPLGSKSSQVLCGCVPIEDGAAMHERKKQLKSMLPALHVGSYGAAIVLRRSIEQLVTELLKVIGSHFILDQAHQRLCLLVKPVLDRDSELLLGIGQVSLATDAAQRDKLDVAEATCALVLALLSVNHPAERSFVRVSQDFFRKASVFGQMEALATGVARIVRLIASNLSGVSPLGKEELWPSVVQWNQERIEWVQSLDEGYVPASWRVMGSASSKLFASMMEDLAGAPIWAALDMLQATDDQDHEEECQASAVDMIHAYLSVQSRLLLFVQVCVRSILKKGQSFQDQNSSSSNGKKRRRSPDSSQKARLAACSRDTTRVCEDLSSYLLDRRQPVRAEAPAMVFALRVLLPLRPLADRVARVESRTIIRAIMVRVEEVMRSCEHDDERLRSGTFTNLVTLLLTHLQEQEMGRFRMLVERVISTLEHDVPAIANVSRIPLAPVSHEAFFDIFDGYHAMQDSSVHGSSKAVADWLGRCHKFTHAVFKMNHVVRRVFLSILVWRSPRALGLNAESWLDSMPVRFLKKLCTEAMIGAGARTGCISIIPILLVLQHHQHSDATNRERLLQNIVGLLAEVFAAQDQDDVRMSCLESIQRVICARACLSAMPDANRGWVSCAARCCPSSPRSWSKTASVTVSPGVLEQAIGCIRQVQNGARDGLLTQALTLAASCLLHCDPDVSGDSMNSFIEYVVGAITDGNRMIRRVAIRGLRLCVERVGFMEFLIESEERRSSSSVMEQLNKSITSAMKSRDYLLLESCIEAIGAISGSQFVTDGNRRDMLVWGLLQLLSLWINTHSTQSPVSTAVFDQMSRVFMRHNTSWKALFTLYPEDLYFPVIDGLLRARCLNAFAHLFFGLHFDETILLRDSAPYVLPQYIVDRQEDMLSIFVETYKGEVGDDDVHMDGDELSERYPSSTTILQDLVLHNIGYVVKELIIHQVEAETNENLVKEWEFFFRCMPENVTIRDAIIHSPLRLLNLLAWELGGERPSSARKAFREISQYLIKGNDPLVGEVDKALMMPRQYFLALMTDLGNRISKKGPNSSVTHRIRAIRSIHRLFGMYKRQGEDGANSVKGALDPFVPKVMAILKIGLNEKQLQAYAIQAWGVFVRMLTPKALESNFASIVVSVLPCIPQAREALQVESHHDGVSLGLVKHENFVDLSIDEETKQEETETKNPSMGTAIGILKYLFIDRRAELHQSFPRVRLIPPIDALDDVYASYVAEVGDPSRRSLTEFLTSSLPFVTHWDLGVREIILGELHQVLVARANDLRQLLQSEDDDVDPSVVEILFAILQVARTDTSEAVRLLCAKCLGALGAIDGARIPLNVLGSSKDKAETRLEYSTKDLALVLIENWLVKELRGAPENMDVVALSIQELLKFLAELTEDPQHSGQKLDGAMNNAGKRVKPENIPPMPEWIKRRFERKDVLEFVEPYWYTNYSLASMKKTRVDSSTTFYEKFSTTYEEWLYSWCRRLIDLSQPPERKIFQACQMVLSTSAQIGRFLVPYLIQNVLRSGRPEVYAEVKREVMAVLKDDGVMDDSTKGVSMEPHGPHTSRGVEDASERAFGEYASRHHQCAQTIVSTIDELNEWVWASEKKRLALSAPASRSTAPTPSRPADLPSDLDDQEKENLEEFLKDIPSQSLSNSAFRIKAYARALQYFEVYLRQQQPEPKKKESASTSSMPTFPVDLKLISKHATYLQQLYSRVDEPDALTGLATLRRLYDAYRQSEPANERAVEIVDETNSSLTYLLHQVVDHEQLAQWEDALACYEQAIQEVQSDQASHTFYIEEADSEEEPRRDRDQLVGMSVARDPRSVKPALYSGIVQCLIQLGRLESALQHINGIVTQEPQFVGTLYPHALECAWRLSRWELVSELLNSERQTSLLSNSLVQGGVSSRLRNLDVSQLSLVRVLHSFHQGNHPSFLKDLQEARTEIMGPLAAACAESYQRAYPLLHKLHFLHEAEQGFISLQASKDMGVDARGQRWNAQCPWDARYELLSASLKFRDPILALRRVMLQEADLRSEVSHNWLSYAKIARKEGYIRTANSAVMHAEALDNPYASLEKAKLMVAQDRMYEALQILEPVDIDAAKLDYKVEDPHYCAKNLLLATNWMQASGQRQGRKVIERYEAVIKFDPKWEKGYFFLAKYYEYLLSVSHPEAPTTLSSSNSARNEDSSVNIDSVFHSHLINLMKNYILALSHGTKHVFQSMPRLLTLWFEYGELLQPGSNKGSSGANKALRNIEMELSQSSAEQHILTDIAHIMLNAAGSLPAYEWLVCFPQVTSRICHPNSVVVDGVKKIMMKVLTTYPTQAMWPLLGLSRSLNSQRRNRAREIIAAAQRHFVTAGQQEIANGFAEGMRLAEELISLAGHDPANQRRIRIQLTRIRTKILVPVQAGLNTVLPSSGLAPADNRHVAFMPHSQVYIKAFSDKGDVMMTKEKPKRIEVLGTDGKLYPFLCKREKTGDLRKDARMMEFNTMINKLLQKDREGRKRKLRLRTYAVVCLNEESGLMEWVSDTKAMRQLIGQIHKTERGFIQPVRLTHDIKERFLGMQKKHGDNPVMLALYYRSKILSLPVFTPRFHQWFTNNFADPTAWFEARLAFSRSAAVWSMVGHIIGLGDRHGENILIDCNNGECVHVDFDCLFDKGLKLAKPEIVPFRLTPNIIDAFGITGYEGVFRRVCEVTMTLLRDNRETLRSVLESFVHDPLVEWGRRGKNAQGMATSANGRSIADISTERSKEETRIILKTIDDRLSGIYNLGDAIRPLVSSSHRNLLPENETLPLSVQGQVDKLIHEATSHANLAQMYIGWMPFL